MRLDRKTLDANKETRFPRIPQEHLSTIQT